MDIANFIELPKLNNLVSTNSAQETNLDPKIDFQNILNQKVENVSSQIIPETTSLSSPFVDQTMMGIEQVNTGSNPLIPEYNHAESVLSPAKTPETKPPVKSVKELAMEMIAQITLTIFNNKMNLLQNSFSDDFDLDFSDGSEEESDTSMLTLQDLM
jgi:hypothetical protein